MPCLDDYRAVLCDLDGCLVSGNRVLPGAPAFIEHLGERLWVLSNNSTDTPESLRHRLVSLGLTICANRILLAGALALEHLARDPRLRSLRVFGTALMEDHAATLGITLDRHQPSHVLLTRDPAFTYARLNELIRHLRSGAQLVVANGDTTHPGEDGSPVAETGAWLAALVACLPDLRYQMQGKPEPRMYRSALARTGACGIRATEVLAIGDNPATDGEGARRAGLDCVILGAHDAAAPRALVDLLTPAGFVLWD